MTWIGGKTALGFICGGSLGGRCLAAGVEPARLQQIDRNVGPFASCTIPKFRTNMVGDRKRLIEIPQVATADASAAVLSEIGGTAISEVQLRRFRLALLLGLPLCGRLVLSLALALTAASARRTATA